MRNRQKRSELDLHEAQLGTWTPDQQAGRVDDDPKHGTELTQELTGQPELAHHWPKSTCGDLADGVIYATSHVVEQLLKITHIKVTHSNANSDRILDAQCLLVEKFFSGKEGSDCFACGASCGRCWHCLLLQRCNAEH